MISSYVRVLRRWMADKSGQSAVIFALSALPVLGVTGLAVDYGFALSTKAKLDQAADAAALAAVVQAKSYVLTYTGSGDPTAAAIASGQAQGQAQWNANKGTLPAGTMSNNTVTVTRPNSGQTISATVTYTYTMPTVFMAALGNKSMSFSGTTQSTLTMDTYVNLYVVLDNSESMGIGATQNDMNIVFNATGCAIACHYDKGTGETTSKARAAGAQLRIDVAKNALMQGLGKISSGGNFQVAVYTISNQFTQVFPAVGSLSNNIALAQTAIQTIDVTSSNLDGGSNLTYALNQLYKKLPAAGNGLTQATAQGVIMLVTDGVQDSDQKVCPGNSNASCTDQNDPNFTVFNPCNYANCNKDSNFGLYFQSFDPKQCAPLKTNGYTMMTLNAQYLVPPVSQQGSAAFQQVFSYIQNNLQSSIASNMSACATAAKYAFSASSPTDIATAVNQMFGSIPQPSQARLSQ